MLVAIVMAIRVLLSAFLRAHERPLQAKMVARKRGNKCCTLMRGYYAITGKQVRCSALQTKATCQASHDLAVLYGS